MADFPFQDELESFKLFGNTGYDYLIAFGLLFIYLLIFFIVKIYTIRRIKKVKEDDGEKKQRREQIAKTLSKGFNTTLAVLISLNYSIRSLELPTSIKSTLSIILLGLVAFYLVKISNLTITVGTSYYIGKKADMRHVIEFLKVFLQALMAIIIFLWFLSSIGVNITAYIAGLSVLALAIAFAIQNIIADIFASLILFFDKPFELGDSIRVGSDSGKVEKIGIRSTHIRTPTGNILIISNRELTSQRINNMTNMNERRIVFNLGVSYETNVGQLKQIPEWVKSIVDRTDNARFDRCYLINLGASSYDFEIVYFITTKNMKEYLDAQQSIFFDVLQKLEDEKIEIPFPTQTVYRK